MSGIRRGLQALVVLVSGVALIGCGSAEPSGGQTTANETEQGSETEPVSETEPASETEQQSDGGGAERSTAEPTAAETAWCEVPAFDLTVLRSDDGVSCQEVEEIFADVDTWSYADGTAEEDPGAWNCAIASGQVHTPSVFTEVPMCVLDDSHLTALPKGTVPLDGFAVDMSEHAVFGSQGAEYGFTVPGSDLVCSIVPGEGEERGRAGCHGTFEEGIEAPAPDGTGPANTIEISEDGAGFAAHSDPAYWPLGPDGDFADDVTELPTGAVLSAYGVVCQSLEGGTVSCTAGEETAMTVSATAHEFRP
ncbi:MAG: hypothetical protein ACTHUU_02875 [Brachybacterium sp.]